MSRRPQRVQQLPSVGPDGLSATRLCLGAGGLLGYLTSAGEVAVWDVDQARSRQVWAASSVPFTCVAVDPGGAHLLVGSEDGAVALGRIASEAPELVLLPRGSGGPVRAVAVFDRRVATLLDDAEVLVRDLFSSEIVPVVSPLPVDRVGFTPAGHLVALGPEGAVAWERSALGRAIPLVVPPARPWWPLAAETGCWVAIAGGRFEMRDLTDDTLLSGRPRVRMLQAGGARSGVLLTSSGLLVNAYEDGVQVMNWQPSPGADNMKGYVKDASVGSDVVVVADSEQQVVLATGQGRLTVLDVPREKFQYTPPRKKPRWLPPDPSTYLPHRLIRSETTISPTVFWALIDRSRRMSAPDLAGDVDDQPVRQAEVLADLLVERTPDEIRGFDQFFADRMDECYRTDLWAVAEIVGGGCSDDGFTDFRAWLIGQGERYYHRALDDPAQAAQRIGGELPNGFDLWLAANEAHERLTDEPLPPLEGGTAPELTGPPYDDPEHLFPRLAMRYGG